MIVRSGLSDFRNERAFCPLVSPALVPLRPTLWTRTPLVAVRPCAPQRPTYLPAPAGALMRRRCGPLVPSGTTRVAFV